MAWGSLNSLRKEPEKWYSVREQSTEFLIPPA